MTAKVYCTTKMKGVQYYFVKVDGVEYYLFSSAFRRSNKNFFARGRYINEVMDGQRNCSESVRRISTRVVGAIKNLESEEGLCIFQQTAKLKQKKRSTKMLRKSENAFGDIA